MIPLRFMTETGVCECFGQQQRIAELVTNAFFERRHVAVILNKVEQCSQLSTRRCTRWLAIVKGCCLTPDNRFNAAEAEHRRPRNAALHRAAGRVIFFDKLPARGSRPAHRSRLDTWGGGVPPAGARA